MGEREGEEGSRVVRGSMKRWRRRNKRRTKRRREGGSEFGSDMRLVGVACRSSSGDILRSRLRSLSRLCHPARN